MARLTMSDDVNRENDITKIIGGFYCIAGRYGVKEVLGITPANTRGERTLQTNEYNWAGLTGPDAQRESYLHVDESTQVKSRIARRSNLIVGGDRGVSFSELKKLRLEEIAALKSQLNQGECYPGSSAQVTT